MIVEDENIIKKLKIEFEGNTYDNIVYVHIDSESISFTTKPDKNTRTNINTTLDKVKIIQG